MSDEQPSQPKDEDDQVAPTADEDAEGQALTWKVGRRPPVEEPEDAEGHAVRPPPERYEPDR